MSSSWTEMSSDAAFSEEQTARSRPPQSCRHETQADVSTWSRPSASQFTPEPSVSVTPANKGEVRIEAGETTAMGEASIVSTAGA
jgi:hypothetical protein